MRRWGSSADLKSGSPMSLDDWEDVKKSSRLALDTSHHGSDAYGSFEPSSLEKSSSADVTMEHSWPYDHQSHSPPPQPIPLQAVLEKEPLPEETKDIENRLRGHSLYKDYLESQGQSLSDVSQPLECCAVPDQREQRIEQFLKSMFGVEDSNETRKVLEFLNFGLSSNISEKELVTGLEQIGYKVDETEMSLLVDVMAPGRDSVNFTQFVASQIDWESLQQTHRETWLECVKHAFESLDKDKDGTLSTHDIVSAIAEKLPNKSDIDAALEQARAEACAAELNMSFEDFLSVLRDDNSMLPLKNFDSRFNDAHPA